MYQINNKTMKWIKDRNKFLNEAKIRDGLYKSQIKEFSNYWGEKYLDYEEVTPTDKIKQGKWKLEDEDKMKVLGAFFQCDMSEVFSIFTNLPDKFNDILTQSIDFELFTGKKKEMYETIFVDFNIKAPTIDQIVLLFDNVFTINSIC